MSPDPARQPASRDQALGEAQPGNGHRPETEPARPDPQGADPVAGDGHAPESGLGQLPLVALLVAIGLLIVSVADALSRATLAPSPLIYWAGILAIGVPVFYRLAAKDASPRERLLLVCLLGMALYAVKVLRDSLFFTIPDEFIHAFNAEQIVQQGELFTGNPIQGISPDYPGLEGATSALMSLTGMSSYGSGILVIGAARLVLLIGLFVLFRRISGSARIAGLGTAIYVCNYNFVFFSAQYSYQSLALPLFVVVLMALAERQAAPRAMASAWAATVVLATTAVVLTHHLTSYALAGILALLAILYWRIRGVVHWPNPWPFAAYAAGLSLLWLAIVAGATVDYLQPVLDRALDSIGNTISGESNPRTLFQASAEESGGIDLGATPVLARIVSLGSVAVLAIGLPFGLIQLWRRFRAEPMALLLATGAVAFFATLSLRFAREAWETANRASEFFFIGLAFVLALAVVLAYARLDGRGPPSAPWLGRAALAGLFGLVLAGGAISGWPWDAHMPRPVRAEAAGNAIESESLALSRWAEEHLPEERFAASDADARMLLAPGGVRARAGRHPDVEDILLEQTFTEFDCEGRCSTTPEKGWELPLLRRFNLRFVVADRRRRSFDVTRGYYFSVRPPGGDADQRLRGASVSKFAQIPTATRVFDSGNIVVYDLEGQR